VIVLPLTKQRYRGFSYSAAAASQLLGLQRGARRP